ncbi:ABC transporter permease [Arachidicoccus rhizosphaerae]|uniref:ABC transporter permease n=1 Tax=Arachidicoccus rhizosphaerae TaxID=551991 RepID=UPI0021CD85EE|nr:ABC transporter permease [Arachidicoccus rhizosphaerae]
MLGLAVGLAAGIILLIWVNQQLSFNRFHTKADRIYQLNASFTSDGQQTTFKNVPGAVGYMAKSLKEVQVIQRIYEKNDQTLSIPQNNRIFDGIQLGYIDSNFLKIFDFKLLKGQKSALLPQIHTIALTEEAAHKLFGNQDPLQQIVEFQGKAFTVSAVLQNFPDNSSLHYDALLPMAYYEEQFKTVQGSNNQQGIDQNINLYSFTTFLLIKNPADAAMVGQELTQAFSNEETSADVHINLQNIRQVHLITADGNDAALQMVHIMLTIALTILLIAGINYINLSTARALGKSRQVAVKKIMGARRHHLFLQYIVESTVIFVTAFLLALLIIGLTQSFTRSVTGLSIFAQLTRPNTWWLIILAAICTLFVASIYPALSASNPHPVQALNGTSKAGGRSPAALLKKALIIFQFGISFALVATALLMHRQMDFIRQKDLGYNKDFVLVTRVPPSALAHVAQIKAALSHFPAIKSAGFAGAPDPSDIRDNTGHIQWPGQPDNTLMMIGDLQVDQSFIPTLQYQLLEGHNFRGDSSDQHQYILNQTAVTQMRLKPPYIGQKISFHERPGEIIGVLKDFNFKPLNEKIAPFILYTNQVPPSYLYIRANGQQLDLAIKDVKTVYERYAGNRPFKYDFLDDKAASHYSTQYRTNQLFNLFSGIAIFLSCMGLFGLISFSVQARIKEIAMRKVLGASPRSLLKLLSQDFLALVIIGSILFAPLTYWWINHWLQDFAYKITFSNWIFVIGFGVILLVAILTIGLKVVTAIKANPTQHLKSE